MRRPSRDLELCFMIYNFYTIIISTKSLGRTIFLLDKEERDKGQKKKRREERERERDKERGEREGEKVSAWER